MKKETSCGAVIARQTDTGCEILLIRHENGGHWAFPKGHVEENETETETALREIREETGLAVTLDTGFRAVVTYSPETSRCRPAKSPTRAGPRRATPRHGSPTKTTAMCSPATALTRASERRRRIA